MVEIRSPYNDSLVALVHRAGPDEIEKAIAAAVSRPSKLPVGCRRGNEVRFSSASALESPSDARSLPGPLPRGR